MEFKRTRFFELPVIGLGTWTIGGDMARSSTNDESDLAGIKKAIEMGYSHIDTAEVYGDGHAEDLVGKAIQDRDREKLILTSKVYKTHLAYEDVLKSCNASLKRLGTDYLDLYLIHSPKSHVPIEETMKAMNFLVDEGTVRNIGVSNFSVEQLKKAQACSDAKIVNNQVHYSLTARNSSYSGLENIEREVIPYCQENEILITAYRPVKLGELTKVQTQVLNELSVKYDTTQKAIALNWLLSKKNIVAIIKSTNIAHLKENLEATKWTLSKADIKKLDEI